MKPMKTWKRYGRSFEFGGLQIFTLDRDPHAWKHVFSPYEFDVFARTIERLLQQSGVTVESVIAEARAELRKDG